MNGAPEIVSAAEAAISRNHVGVVDQIVAEHGADHQNFVLEAGDKQRADRAVDQTSVSVSFSVGRASRLKKPPGTLPAA